MSVYDAKSLKEGISGVSGKSAQNGKSVQNGSDNLYRRGYNLEIEHVPTGYKVKFPAYLDNFSDAFTQSWNAEDVYGRMDPIAVYQNTRRAIAMSWHVPANSFEQAKENMDVVNTLMTFMYPRYSSQGGSSVGSVLNMSPLVRVKFVNLIHNAANSDLGLLGYINGFTVDVRSENGMFMQNKVDDAAVAVYPKTVTLNFELNVLHEHAMGWTTGKEGDPVLRESVGGFPYRTNLAVPASTATSDEAPKTSAKAKETDPGANAGENALKGSE